MASHTIEVMVGVDKIEVEPETLTMTLVDDVRWAGTTSTPFSIVFTATDPFGQQELPHSTAIEKQSPLTQGLFKYTIVSGSLELDPVIVVEEPPTGSNP